MTRAPARTGRETPARQIAVLSLDAEGMDRNLREADVIERLCHFAFGRVGKCIASWMDNQN
jgi:hypothetical protein